MVAMVRHVMTSAITLHGPPWGRTPGSTESSLRLAQAVTVVAHPAYIFLVFGSYFWRRPVSSAVAAMIVATAC